MLKFYIMICEKKDGQKGHDIGSFDNHMYDQWLVSHQHFPVPVGYIGNQCEL